MPLCLKLRLNNMWLGSSPSPRKILSLKETPHFYTQATLRGSVSMSSKSPR
jgi:hypothetical protein